MFKYKVEGRPKIYSDKRLRYSAIRKSINKNRIMKIPVKQYIKALKTGVRILLSSKCPIIGEKRKRINKVIEFIKLAVLLSPVYANVRANKTPVAKESVIVRIIVAIINNK